MKALVLHLDRRAPSRATGLVVSMLLCLAPACGDSVFAQAQAPVEPWAGLRSVSRYVPYSLSSDGRFVAVTMRDQRRMPAGARATGVFSAAGTYSWGQSGDVVVLEASTGESRVLTGGVGNNWGPSWSPDGRHIAFYSDRSGTAQLWLWEAASGALRPLSAAAVRPLRHAPQWTLDGRSLIVRVPPPGQTPAQANALAAAPTDVGGNDASIGLLLYRSSRRSGSNPKSAAPAADAGAWSLDQRLTDVGLIEVGTGQVTRLASGQRIGKIEISPDGREIAFSAWQRFRAPGSQQILSDLIVCGLHSRSCRAVARDLLLSFSADDFSWSPDSERIGYIAGGVEADGAFHVVPRGGGNGVRVPPPTGSKFSRQSYWDRAAEHAYLLAGQSLWQARARDGALTKVAEFPAGEQVRLLPGPGGSQAWSPDGNSLMLWTVQQRTREGGFLRVDLATGQSTVLWRRPLSLVASLDSTLAVTADRQNLVFVVESTHRPDELWTSDALGTAPRRLSNLNPDLPDSGTVRHVEWQTTDGAKLRGALLLPERAKEGLRPPLVIEVYGGNNRSESINRYGAGSNTGLAPMLAARGFAVLAPDAPQRLGTPMSDLARTVLPAIDALASQGLVDPERVGVMGQSYGGYSSLSLIAQSTRFKAAVMVCGYGDLFAAYGSMRPDGATYSLPIMETGQGLMGVTPWDDPKRYWENSPIYSLHRVETPLLIVHGTADDAIPAHLSDQVFVGLRRLGKEVSYAKYDGADHDPGYWTYSQRIDYFKRAADWMEMHLRTRPLAQRP